MSRRPVPRSSSTPARRERAGRWLTWSEATEAALYGHGGFYHRPEGPAGHFRTSVHASGLFAAAVLALLTEVDDLLGRPGRLDFVDVGAGRGELLTGIRALLAGDPDLGARTRLHGVDLALRPPGLALEIGWTAELPEPAVGLVFANEWLDNVPVDVVEAGPDGPRRVLVDPADGSESPGGPVGLRDAGWLSRWWPLDGMPEGSRAEVGFPRDAAWAAAVGSLERGVAVAVDYGHLRLDRVAGRYAGGTLTGYREGRSVRPVPDGSCDLTSYVAMDACAAAGIAAGATGSTLLDQREVLGRLLPQAPAEAGARASLEHANVGAELRDPAGLGGFSWLAQSVGIDLPGSLSAGAADPRRGAR